MTTIVFDAGAVLAVERRDKRIVTLLSRARDNDWTIVVPSSVVAETWRGGNDAALVARLFRAVHEFPALDRSAGMRTGILLARAAARGGAHVVDAHVVDVAIASAPCLLVTSDGDDIRRLLLTDDRAAEIAVFEV